jgi:hypothetical protein
MTITITTAIRYLAGPALAASFALAAPAAALAEAVWDIGLYDDCMKVATTTAENDRCCLGSGGNFGSENNPDGSLKCVAPPAEQTFNPTIPGPFRPATAGVDDDPMAGKPKPNIPITPGTGVG